MPRPMPMPGPPKPPPICPKPKPPKAAAGAGAPATPKSVSANPPSVSPKTELKIGRSFRVDMAKTHSLRGSFGRGDETHDLVALQQLHAALEIGLRQLGLGDPHAIKSARGRAAGDAQFVCLEKARDVGGARLRLEADERIAAIAARRP